MATLKNYQDFFKDDSVRITCPYPKTCFKKKNVNLESELSFLIHGKERLFFISTKKYNEFLSLNMDEIVDYFYGFDYLSKRDDNIFISFTNIYPKKFEIISEKKWTYSKYMYKKWADFADCVKIESTNYKYIKYIDIENFYRNIYTHFICALGISSFDDFKKIKFFDMNQRKKYLEKNKNLYLLKKFEKRVCSKLCFSNETCGLPIGNGLSDFVAEQLLLLIEFYLQSIIKNINFKWVRFRDDIYVFCDDKKDINFIYHKFKEILFQFKIFINYDKTSKILSKKNKQNLLVKKIYLSEQKYKQNLCKQFGDNLISIKKFIWKYPYSNKVFTIFRKFVYSNYSLSNDDIKNITKFYNRSHTNIMPWLVCIIDKTNDKKKISKFIDLIKKSFLSESDIIWINCLSKKYNIKTKSLSDINKKTNSYVLDIINKINTKNANFKQDADTFNY